jgi:hypothetical protein
MTNAYCSVFLKVKIINFVSSCSPFLLIALGKPSMISVPSHSEMKYMNCLQIFCYLICHLRCLHFYVNLQLLKNLYLHNQTMFLLSWLASQVTALLEVLPNRLTADVLEQLRLSKQELVLKLHIQIVFSLHKHDSNYFCIHVSRLSWVHEQVISNKCSLNY